MFIRHVLSINPWLQPATPYKISVIPCEYPHQWEWETRDPLYIVNDGTMHTWLISTLYNRFHAIYIYFQKKRAKPVITGYKTNVKPRTRLWNGQVRLWIPWRVDNRSYVTSWRLAGLRQHYNEGEAMPVAMRGFPIHKYHAIYCFLRGNERGK